jgi:hypothetical protein
MNILYNHTVLQFGGCDKKSLDYLENNVELIVDNIENNNNILSCDETPINTFFRPCNRDVKIYYFINENRIYHVGSLRKDMNFPNKMNFLILDGAILDNADAFKDVKVEETDLFFEDFLSVEL